MASYLQEKDTSSVAHKLNGQILEKIKQHEKVHSSVCHAINIIKISF